MKVASYLKPILCLLCLNVLLAAQGNPNRSAPPAISARDARITTLPGPSQEDRSLESWIMDLRVPDASKRGQDDPNIVPLLNNAGPAIPALLMSHLRDEDAIRRVKAVIAFRLLPKSCYGPTSTTEVVKSLARMLANDPEATVRYEAAVTLNRFAGKNKAAIAALIQGTQDRGSWEIRHACVDALPGAGGDPKMGPDPRATRALLHALKDRTHPVRLSAIRNLGFMGPPSDPRLLREVVSALENGSRSTTGDRTTVLWANVSLVLLSAEPNEKALDAIARDLTSRESAVRLQGIHALGVLGKKAQSKVPDLVRLLENNEDTVVIAAAGALTVMGDQSERVLRPLIDLTRRDKDHAGIVYHACMSLSRIGKARPEVVKALEDVSKRESLPRWLRSAVDAALKDMLERKSDRPKRRGVSTGP